MNLTIVFIAYYFFPNKEVAANRIRFWIKDIEKYYNDITPVVISGTTFKENEKITEHQYFVETGKGGLPSLFIQDEGIAWQKEVQKFLSDFHISDQMAFVITGGPFMHFSLSKYLKKHDFGKVVLDFRDPFAINPRFNNSFFKIWIKKLFEKGFVKYADKVTSVNKVCLSLISGYEANPDKFHVIPNGFDQETFELAKKQNPSKELNVFRIIYPGKYYENASPNNLWKVIDAMNNSDHRIEYVHFGKPMVENNSEKIYSFISERGVQDYQEVINEVLQSNVGILHTTGDPFESSTKIFDYIGAEIPILIITEGEKETGTIHEITKNYPAVKWSVNEKSEIQKCLIEIMQLKDKISFPERNEYSRRRGLEKLINLIQE